LSMNVDITIKNENGGQLGNAPNTVYQTDVFAKYGDQADAEIARIIQANEGSSGPGTGSSQKTSAAGASKSGAQPASKQDLAKLM
jgi:membrane fusion protein, multidrug efflux system